LDTHTTPSSAAMVDSSRATASQGHDDDPQFLSDGWNSIVEGLLQVQRAQLQALIAWQQAIALVQREASDAWICRWGGGAPIDA
jgi:hypothetical protein